MLGNDPGFRQEGLLLLRQGKGARSHLYMCWAEHRGNYRNLPTHTLDHQPYVSLKVLFLGRTILGVALLKETWRLLYNFLRGCQ